MVRWRVWRSVSRAAPMAGSHTGKAARATPQRSVAKCAPRLRAAGGGGNNEALLGI